MRTLFLMSLAVVFLFSSLPIFSIEPSSARISKGDSLDSSFKRISVTASSEPSTFVSSVNVIFGNLLFASQDLAVPGPLSLNLIRYYNSENNDYNWIPGTGMSTNYPLWIQGVSVPREEDQKKELFQTYPKVGSILTEPSSFDIQKGDRHNQRKYAYALATLDGGSVVRCAAKYHFEKKNLHFYIDPETIHKGFTNAGCGEISARTNLKNIRFHTQGTRACHNGPLYKAVWTVTLPDGGTRIYHSTYNFLHAMNLKQEEKPNGNKLMFDYVGHSSMKGYLKSIRATNHSHAHDFGQLKIHHFSKKGGVRVVATNGKEVLYKSFLKKTKATEGYAQFLRSVESSDLPTTTYRYCWADDAFLICRIERPEGRFLRVKYDKEKRVISQSAPVGPNNKKCRIYTFDYHPSDYYTRVLDANTNKTVYHYTSRKRLKRVHRYDAHDKLLRTERFFWGEREHLRPGKKEITDEGHLLGRTIESSKGARSYLQYSYDKYGNITEEKLHGNLTGTSRGLFSVSDEGKLKKPVESYSKYYSYTNDRFHLCEKQSEDHGPTIEYEYKKDTDLLAAKFTKEGSHIRIREFYEYNNDGVLIEKIVDDGDSKDKKELHGVTERHMTYITPVRNRVDHGVGQPEEIQEWYVDHGKDRLLKRTTYSYTKEGRVSKESLFDEDNHLQYSLCYEYDSKGNLLRKKHSAGKEWVYVYDTNNNRIKEELVGSGLWTEFLYDAADRLTRKVEHHQNGLLLTTSYTYDHASNKVSSTDHMGRTLRYEYDGLNRVTAIFHPQITLVNNSVVTPSEHTVYNALNRPISVTDLNGATTTYRYTARGEPYRITYPDGSSEKISYHKHGLLCKKVDRHGVETLYTHDFLGRDIEIIVGGVKTTKNTYSPFHLLTTVDPMALKTSYAYDGAGRIIEKQTGGRKTTYAYDMLSRLCSTREYCSDKDYIETLLQHDLFDRVVEKLVRHADGTILSHIYFSYNLLDKVIEEKVGSSPTAVRTTHYEYNSQGLLTKQTDACGFVTTYTYDYTYKNELSQNVVKKTTIDPLGKRLEEIYDAHDRLASALHYSPQGQLLSKVTFRYDGTAHKTQERHYVCVDGAVIRESSVEWTYSPTGEILSCIEQPRTPEEKVTTYSYTHGDLVEKITKPNGIVLSHTYDALGRLSTLISSDTTVNYAYSYDLNDNITQVWDHYKAHVHTRTYDRYGRMEKEVIGDGSTGQFSYDNLNRIVSYSLDVGPSVEYRYRSGHLHKIIRKQGDSELYHHQYDSFDQEGHITQSSMIGSCGTINYTYDLLGRLSMLTSPHFDLFLKQFDAAGNLREMSFKDPLGEVTNVYTYDGLYQLIEEKGTFNTVFKNDSLSNRLQKDATTYSINSLNQLTSDSEDTFTYDKNGNPISVSINGLSYTLSYDGLDRLLAFERPQVSRTEYEYDSWHRRIQKRDFSWEDGNWRLTHTFRYLYFNQREVGCIDEEGRVVEFRVLGLGKGAELGASIALEFDQHVYAPLHDHRGNICVLVDRSDQVASATYRYSAYGEEEIAAGQVVSPWRFSSKRCDSESGFIFFGSRYYSPKVGRFLTPDPIGFTDGPNLYAYVHNSPMILVDPYGLLTQEEAKDCAIGGTRGFGKGAFHGFIHPLDTATKYGEYLRSAGQMAYQRDFSPICDAWSRSSMVDVAEGAARVVGEVAGASAALVPVGRIAKAAGQAVWRGASSLLGRLGSKAASSTQGLFGRETVQAAESALVSPLETVSKSEMVNLVSERSANHILKGEIIEEAGREIRYSGGHMSPGLPGKSLFPKSWDEERILHHISDVATDPKISWIQVSRKTSHPRFVAEGLRCDLGHNVNIRTVIEPGGKGIVTGYPISK